MSLTSDWISDLGTPRLAETDQEAKALLDVIWDELSDHDKAIAPYLRLVRPPGPTPPPKPDPINEIQLTAPSGMPHVNGPDISKFTPWNGRPKRPDSYPNANRIPDHRLPYGFIKAFHLEDTNYDHEAETQWLIETQHNAFCESKDQAWDKCCEPPDLAPEVLELRANFINAVSLNSPASTDDDGTDHWIQIADDTDRTPGLYELPTPAQQALAEWEANSWKSGPVIKYRYDPLPNGRLGLTITSIRHPSKAEMLGRLTPQQVQDIALYLHQHATWVPDPTELAQKRKIIAALITEYGPKWFRMIPGPTPKPDRFTDWERDDPYRYRLWATDEESHGSNERGSYLASFVAIGGDDGQEHSDSDYWHDQPDWAALAE